MSNNEMNKFEETEFKKSKRNCKRQFCDWNNWLTIFQNLQKGEINLFISFYIKENYSRW